MSEVVSHYSISMDQISDFEFRVRFDKPDHPELKMDEPPPLGKDSGPNAGRLLAAAIGNCLSASFLFAARKSGAAPTGMRADVKVEVIRNENRRFRIGRIEVQLDPGIKPEDLEKAKAAAQMFEDFCTITASVRQGIPVDVKLRGLE
ncbi:MAG: OsmC family protein [Acidimicrobiia bacterium]|nr:OsmC family protein [Acidimicrobiia bacterium]